MKKRSLITIVSIVAFVALMMFTSIGAKTDDTQFKGAYSELSSHAWFVFEKKYDKVVNEDGARWGIHPEGFKVNITTHQNGADEIWNRISREDKIRAIERRIADSRRDIKDSTDILSEAAKMFPFSGIGLGMRPAHQNILDIIRGQTDVLVIEISMIFHDSPAQSSPIRIGDRLVSVNGIPVDGYKIEASTERERFDNIGKIANKVNDLIRATEGQVTLVLKNEEKIYTVTLAKAEIGGKIAAQTKALLAGWERQIPELSGRLDAIKVSPELSDADLKELFFEAFNIGAEAELVLIKGRSIEDGNIDQ
ncbi:MAG: hypothetical protein V1867_02315 [Candidatus Falkowbacteria bacterium]